MSPETEIQKSKRFTSPWVGIGLGALIGATMGIGYRVLSNSLLGSALVVMSVTFLAVCPFIIGFVSVRFSQRQHMTRARAIVTPWLSVFLMLLACGILAYEGFICMVMYLPLALVMSSLGGLLAYEFKKPIGPAAMLCLCALPFILGAAESKITPPEDHLTIQTDIEIMAPPQAVWNEIKSVKTISSEELGSSFVHHMGFPKPLSATIDHEGVGGVRLATFERGLVFVETVHTFDTNKTLGFSIDVDPEQIPKNALDSHVTIGGPYFDVLDGQYDIEPTSQGVVLHLKSAFRVSTTFNGYASLWVQAVMNQIQLDILQVIKKRAEKHG
jgi:hypothetical protein